MVVVNYAARKLIRRCYEYREAIREELQSSVAYVADAGRWIIGLEDWNTKMEKRLGQITELVILANSLLMEYALTGDIGAKGAENDLSLYVHGIINSIVLQDDALFKDSLSKSKPNSATTSPRDHVSPKAKSPSFQVKAPTLELQTSIPEDDVQVNEDDDLLNPFSNIREAYFAPPNQEQTQPMAIPAHVRATTTSESSPHSSSTKSHSYSDYCHLDQEYADTLSEMTSFPTHKEWSKKAKKNTSPPSRSMESSVHDLTVSMDLQKEHANNPFLKDLFVLNSFWEILLITSLG
ncbi:hypothetical protein THRCLA_03058 [Thraustotheca clavata]|uniref:Uncharacterized protein n=1 Tax=Thraustotheca clavata TaxID=74557 RepID=A0A1W0A354_9STRA|nr:hypothetical protein THRCLA_03058 [Thraustotheca clavata]